MGTDTQIEAEKEQAIIFFDGICNLCNGAVQFIIRKDPNAHFKFASLQSSKARELLPDYGVDPNELESILLLENGKLFTKSTAALNISRKLSGIWPTLILLKIIPPAIRDFMYDWIANNRYKWFGKRDECMIPTPEMNTRFLEV